MPNSRELTQRLSLLRTYWPIGLIASIAFIVRLRHLGAPIGGSYDFRQTQTAWGVRSMLRGSPNPFAAEVPVLGPPWKLPFEFPFYQWCSAMFARILSLGELAASRIVAAVFFVMVVVLSYFFVRRVLDAAHATAVAIVLAFSSFGLVYGTTILVDFSSLLFALAALGVSLHVVAKPSRRGYVALVVLAAMAHLTKITTSVAWLGIGLPIALYPWRQDWRRKTYVFAAVWVSVLPYLLWNLWADSVKSSSPTSAFLVSGRLREWTFGTFAQRLDLLEWLRRYESFTPQVSGNVRVFTVLALLAIAHSRGRRLLAVCLAVAIGTPFVFTNLYRHEYYNIALYPAYAVVAVLGVSQALNMLSSASKLDVGRVRTLLLALVFVLTAWSWRGDGYGELATKWWYNPAGMNDAYVDAVINIRDNTPEDAVIIVPDVSWDPSFLFHADRRGLILDSLVHTGDEFSADQLGTLYTHVYWFDERSMTDGWEKWGLDAVPREQINERLFRLKPVSD